MLKQFFSKVDSILLIAISFILVMSLMTIYSIKGGSGSFGFFEKHVLSICIGLGISFLLAFFDYRVLKQISKPFYILIISSIIILIVMGKVVKGAASWFHIGPFAIEPIEYAKIVTIIHISKYLSSYRRHLFSFKYIIYSGVPIFGIIGLAILQPDLGSSTIIGVLWLLMIIMGGIRMRHIIVLVSSLLLIGGIFWVAILHPYQKDRILTFLNPTADPLGRGYNVIQSITAVGMGGVHGQGLGQGLSGQLRYVPEIHTDFIFAGFAQNWGFVGVSIYFILFLIIMWRLILIAWRTDDYFSHNLIVGFIILFSFQSFINIGMNMGMLPVTGVPLPFMSYGGSSMMTFFILLGFVFSIQINGNQRFSPQDEGLFE